MALDLPDATRDESAIILEEFLPYRLSVLSNTISSAIAGAYASRFGLTINEWRIIAVLGRFPGLAARDVADKTAMDKVAVSRAVNRLRNAGLVNHRTAHDDRRRSMLELSDSGHELLAQVAPMAMEYEAQLLDGLGPGDRNKLGTILARLQHRAREIGPLGKDGTDSKAD